VEVRGELVEGSPKTHQARTVPIPRFLVDEPGAHVEGRASDDLVFCGPTGAPLRNSNFRRRHWDRAVKACGLDGVTPHDLRHTAASLPVAAGANVKAVQRMLGHASAAHSTSTRACSVTTSTRSRTCSTPPPRRPLRTGCGPERPTDGYSRSPRARASAVTCAVLRAREENRTPDLRITSLVQIGTYVRWWTAAPGRPIRLNDDDRPRSRAFARWTRDPTRRVQACSVPVALV
jgi:hypothetical protein